MVSLNPQDMDQQAAQALMEESEQEEPRFEITYTPILGGHALEVEGSFATLDEARDKSAEVYEEMDITDCRVEDHEEEWQPLNLQAKWLIAEEERQERRAETKPARERQETLEFGNVLPIQEKSATTVSDQASHRYPAGFISPGYVY